jgi:hypothetical protein
MTTRKREEDTQVIERNFANDLGKLAVKHWKVFLIAIGLGWNPAHDLVTAALPLRGTKSSEQYRSGAQNDSRELVEDLNASRRECSNSVFVLNAKVDILVKTVEHLGERIDNVLDRREPAPSPSAMITTNTSNGYEHQN